MRKFAFAFVLSALMISTGCTKEITDSIDITEFEWKLDCITAGRDKTKAKCKGCFNSNPYVLQFRNDSTFNFNTSVNEAMGSFAIEEKGNFKVFYYGEITLVGGGNMIDEQLLKYLPLATSYEVFRNKLIIQADNCEMTFRKK